MLQATCDLPTKSAEALQSPRSGATSVESEQDSMSNTIRSNTRWQLGQLVRVSLAFFCNFVSGPATVMSNKMVFVSTGFRFPILLTVAHYGSTWIMIKAMSKLGIYSPAQAQLWSSKDAGAGRAVCLLIISWSFYNIMSNLVSKFCRHLSDDKASYGSRRSCLGCSPLRKNANLFSGDTLKYRSFRHLVVHCI